MRGTAVSVSLSTFALLGADPAGQGAEVCVREPGLFSLAVALP
jgi:hypothetical protein